MTSIIPPNTGLNRARSPFVPRSQFSRQPRFAKNHAAYSYNTGYSQMLTKPTVVSETKNPDGSTTTHMSNGSFKISKHDEVGNVQTKHYNPQKQLTFEYTRENGKSIGKQYDQDGRVTILHNEERDENGKTVVDKFTNYEYSDNGNIKSESVEDRITGETTTLKYDENGNRTEKFVKKGAVTTYYDAEDKPVRRETNKGAGIVETEDLTE